MNNVIVSKVSDDAGTTYAVSGPKAFVGKKVIDVFMEHPISKHSTQVTNVLHLPNDQCTVVVRVNK